MSRLKNYHQKTQIGLLVIVLIIESVIKLLKTVNKS